MKQQMKEKDIKPTNILNNQMVKVALAASILLTGATSTIATVGPSNGVIGELLEMNHAEAAGVFAGGTGTVADPYLVSDKVQLNEMRNFLKSHFKLTENIDLSSTTWTPIGTASIPFTGNFNGNGHTINGLTINSSTPAGVVGLFGAVTGDIQNVHLTNVDVKGTQNVGGLAGQSTGTIQSVTVEGKVVGTGNNIGGVVGFYQPATSKKIEDVASFVNVTGLQNIGGIAGYSYSGTFQNIFSMGDVTGTNTVGGIVGYVYKGTFSNIYSTGDVTGTSNVGGLIGVQQQANLSNAYATGSVMGDSYTGGLVGNISGGTHTNLYALNKSVLSDVPSSTTGKAIGTSTGANLTNVYMPETSKGVGMQQFVTGLLTNEEVRNKETYDTLVKTGMWEIDKQSNLPVLTFNKQSVEHFSLNDKVNYVEKDGVIYAAINTAAELAQMNNSLNVPYLLMNDIDLSGIAWTPIGTASKPFAGNFNGNGHTINGLTVNSTIPAGVVGLFGAVTGDIQNVHLTNVDVKGTQNVGGLAGQSTGTIQSVTVQGKIVGTGNTIGGVVGLYQGANSKKIEDVASFVNVTGLQSVGGIVGYMLGGTIQNIFSTGDITGTNSVGGNVGYVYKGTFSNIYSTGDVTGTSNVGGLIGVQQQANLSNAYATGSVMGDSYTGGLVGNISGGSHTNLYALNKSVLSVEPSSTTGKAFGTSARAIFTNIQAIDSMSGTGHVIGVTGTITALQAMQKDSYLGLDFGDLGGKDIWKIDEGSSIPYLSFNPKPMQFNPGDGTWGEIDFTPPNPATFSLSTTGWTKDGVLLTVLFPKDAKTKEIRIDNDNWEVYTEPIIIDKNTTVEARSFDAAENQSAIAKQVITNIDKDVPVISNVNVTNGKLVIQATDIGSGLKTVEYRLNGLDWQEYTSNISLVGSQLIEVRATDKTENVSDIVSYKYVDEFAEIAAATESVIKAEGTNAQEDVDSARALVDILSTGTIKTELTNRLNAVQKEIDEAIALAEQIAKATEAVVKAEGSQTQVDMDTARDLVSKLPNGEVKTDLTNRLDAIQQATDEDKSLEEAKDAVDNLGDNPTQEELDKVKDKVDELSDGPAKDILLDEIKEKQEALNQANATKAVEKAETSKTQTDVTTARNLVNKLSGGEVKTDLTNRLDVLQQAIDAAKYLEEVRSLVNNLGDNPTQVKIDQARSAVDGLLDSVDKTELSEMVEAKQNALDAKVADAREAVEAISTPPTLEEIAIAQEKVNVLPAGEIKNDLQKQINDKKKQIDDVSDQLAKAEAAVTKAESFPTNYNVTIATKLVQALPNSEVKTALEERLQAIQDVFALEKAEAKVKQAENYERDPYLADAITLVDALRASDAKQALKDRLQVILDKLQAIKDAEEAAKDSNGEYDPADPNQSIEDAINTIQDKEAKKYFTNWNKAVSNAENFFSKTTVKNATKYLTELPDAYTLVGSYENIIKELTERTQNLKAEEVAVDVFAPVEKAVAMYEKFQSSYYLKKATEAVQALTDSPEKTAFEIRLGIGNDNGTPGNEPTEEEKLATQLASVEKAVATYEKYKTNFYQKKATQAVGLLSESEAKTAFQARLDAVAK